MRSGKLAALVLALLLAVPVQADAVDRAAVERQFASWLKQQIWPAAIKRGVSARTFNTALGGVSPDWRLPGLVPPGTKAVPQDQSQAEFRSPGRYFKPNIMAGVVSGGTQRLRDNGALLDNLQRQTGVPGRIVIAIWGRESGFGRASIPHNAFRVLATKAFMSTRPELFTEELLSALVMAQQSGIDPATMKSSWAGALGQPQFMPSSFLKYAVDGSGDGRVDIWNSVPDTLASIANYLARHGWVSGRDWGFEVTVPQSVPCHLEGPDQGRPISEWVGLGVQRVSGRPFPDHERDQPGFLLMPAGRYGPAFIVTENFYVLKEYNESDVYALFVGHAGDRIQFGVKPFTGSWQPVAELNRGQVATMQRALEGLGHDVGGADGLAGFKTRRSIGRWQAASARQPTCYPDRSMLSELR